MKKTYVSPDIQMATLSKEDVLLASDVLINGEDLFVEN